MDWFQRWRLKHAMKDRELFAWIAAYGGWVIVVSIIVNRIVYGC